MPIFSGGGGAYLTRTITLTNADILGALQHTSIEDIPAPGPNKIIVGPSAGHGFVVVRCDTSGGVYTGVGTATMDFGLGGDISTAYSPSAFGIESLLTSGGDVIMLLSPADAHGDQFPDSLSALVNQPEAVSISNTTPFYAGGDPANRMSIIIGYRIINVPNF